MNDDVFDRAETLGGVPVLGLLPHSPAALAGVRVGDVLLEVDGQQVGNLAQYIQARLGQGEPRMRVRLVRAGMLHDIEIDLRHGAHRTDAGAAVGVLRAIFAEQEPEPDRWS